ncbi:MAG TPA: hypothetical protein VI792_08800 [Candidatus Eisenbacteria bacterium]
MSPDRAIPPGQRARHCAPACLIAALLLAAPACLIAALLLAAPARAQVLAMVSPTQASLTAVPGEPLEREVVVSNMGAVPVRVRVRLSDWTLSEYGEIGLAALGSTARSLDGAVRFAPGDLLIRPGDNGRIHLRIDLGSGGAPTRWGMLMCEVRSAVAAQDEIGPRAVTELGTTLLVSRLPADQVRADITGLKVRVLGRDSIAITARVANTGLRHLFVTGAASLRDSSATPLGGGPLPPGLVLPGMSRYFEWTGHVTHAPGRCVASATLDYGVPELLVGETKFRWAAADPPGSERAQR